MFDLTNKWVKLDAHRGYNEPIYAVCGANDTGGWEDSPCPTEVALRELKAVEEALKQDKIPFKFITCETSNVFCVHHYLVVPPKEVDKAKKLVDNYVDQHNTRLLYKV
jgi:predicted phosphodiesterase